jgi:hypothetical protein
VAQRLGVGIGGQRLFHQRDAGGARRPPGNRLEDFRRPGLVGIGDEHRIRRGGADGGEPLGDRRSPPSLTFSMRAAAPEAANAASCHRLGRAQAQIV